MASGIRKNTSKQDNDGIVSWEGGSDAFAVVMEERRILILTFYYRPDLAAGAFRTTALVEALLLMEPPEVKVDIVTTLPNRYSNFNVQALEWESTERLNIQRIQLPLHKSGMLDQAMAFVCFAWKASKLVKGKQYALVYATSSRLLTAVLGAWIAKRGNLRLYLDIRDIFVDTIKDVLPRYLSFIVKPFFSVTEWWTIRRAVHVNLVSRGFEGYFKARYPKQSFSLFMNGIDEEFMLSGDTTGHSNRNQNDCIRVLYAGNMGEGQGLHKIIPAIARDLQGRAIFKLIGDGGRRVQLEAVLDESGVDNVELVSSMPRTELIKEYLHADVLFLHLNDYEAFKKVLPSKIFEYAALGKPIWAGVSGYAAEFLNEQVSNSAVFHPGNAQEAIQAFNQLEMKDRPRDGFVQKYSRAAIMRAMARNIFDCMVQQRELA